MTRNRDSMTVDLMSASGRFLPLTILSVELVLPRFNGQFRKDRMSAFEKSRH